MKLTRAYFCPDCEELFEYKGVETSCPCCTNRYVFPLHLFFNPALKEKQGETTSRKGKND